MTLGQHEQDDGLFYLSHSRQYNGQTIDKLTFTVPKSYFRKDLFQHKDRVTNRMFYVENCHNQFFKLHLQGEYIDPSMPMLCSVMNVFNIISENCIFLDEINRRIHKIMDDRYDYNYACTYFLQFLRNKGFKFSELELTFDFFGCPPYSKIEADAFKPVHQSLYSNDYKKYYRKMFLDDDSYGKGIDRIRESIFIIYERGRKLCLLDPVWRVEWRLRDERSRRLLDITDLRFSMDDFILEKGHRIRDITNRWIKPGSIEFNREYIEAHFPIFSVLTTG